jgi:hypothetical protein
MDGMAERWSQPRDQEAVWPMLPILGLCNLHTTSWAGSLEAISPTIE